MCVREIFVFVVVQVCLFERKRERAPLAYKPGEESLKTVNGHFGIMFVQSHAGDFNKA